MSGSAREKVDAKLIEEEHVDIEKKKQCLHTALYEVTKRSPFLGSVLQCMDIHYSHMLPTAGVLFDANAKKWNMAINPFWFCLCLSDKNREAVLLHEIYHVTHKHPMRAPFLKINARRRAFMNMAMDMAINQYINDLPKGCKECPPIEAQMKGEACQNKYCPHYVIFVEDYYDLDAKGNKVSWPREKPMEFYYHKLIERYDSNENIRDPQAIDVEHVFIDPLDIIAVGAREKKVITSTNFEDLLQHKPELKVGDRVVLVAQNNAKDNGIYEIVDLGSASTNFAMKRYAKFSGAADSLVYVGDAAIPRVQKIGKAKKPVGWVVTGMARDKDSDLVMVDSANLFFEEQEINVSNGSGGGQGQREFDSHQWDSNSSESEMMDATEELVKRAMQKRGLSKDRLPGFVQDLLDDIEARRAELNYRQLILSAIKRHASGFNREHTWTRPSRRFGNKSPGTKSGNLPKLNNYIDTSGSISVQEANDFLDIVDQFLKVGSRKCNLGLWHTALYSVEQYKLGDRINSKEFNKKFQSGGTDVGPALKHIFETKPDLSIILTDGCYYDVDVESWMRPGEHFPQILWIISKDGQENHPLKRLGETIKIPVSDVMGADRKLEK